MDESALISIGMPVRNNQKTLAAAVQSIINQHYPHWELLLIDDGSTDATLRIAREFADPRIRVLSDGCSRGLPTRLNEAIDASRGTYFARMDGDDVAYPQRLARQIAYMRQHPEVDLVGSWVLVFGTDGATLGKRAGREGHGDICARLVRGIGLVHPTFFGRIDFFRRYRYLPSAVRCEDQDLLLRSYRHVRFAKIPEILLGYREERLDLGKILIGRRFLARAIFREFWRPGYRRLAVQGVVEQGLKAMVDSVAIGTGLNYRVLRHRARPVTTEERSEWSEVWDGLHGAGQAAH